MNGYELLDAVGNVAPEWIVDAEEGKRGTLWKKVLPVAACFCLLIGGVVYERYFAGLNDYTGDDTLTEETADAGAGAESGIDGTLTPGAEITERELDPVQESIAVFPAGESLSNVAEANVGAIDMSGALAGKTAGAREEAETAPEHLCGYLPTDLPAGYQTESVMLYETTMKNGSKYYMVRATYQKVEDSSVVSVMKRFVVFVMNYLPDTEDTIYTLDTLPADLSGKDLCYVAVDDVCIGISDAVDLSADELTRMLLSFRREDRIPVEVGNDAPEADATEAVDAPVEESMYQEQRDYRDEVLELQERISELMVSRELSYVTESMILENPERVHVFVNTTDKEKIAYLKSLDKTGELLEIEYSTDRGVEE